MNVAHPKTKEVLKWFTEITKIPRCSKHEEKIAKWLQDWAKENNFEFKTDKVNNLLIKVPASPGYEKAPIVVIQGHMDMVCEKTPDSKHDFSKDPIQLVFDGDWLKADKTTLGADNGIAIAMALALSLDKDLPHPALELLFTVDEETGLTGANQLQPGFIEGRIMINLDSEDEGVFTVGCAGGINSNLSIPVKLENIPAGLKQYKINAGGMKGGHSGIDIKLGKANAIRILGRALFQLQQEQIDVRIADLKGGSAHNAIPRDAYAIVFLAEKDVTKAKKVIEAYSQIFNAEFKKTDPDLKVTIDAHTEGNYQKVFSAGDCKHITRAMLVMHHGVAAMSPEIAGLVETSNNFANISVDGNTVKILSSQRSSVVSRLKEITSRVEAVAVVAGGAASSSGGYPPWQPNMESALLKKSIKLYEDMFHKKPIVEVIHAGLECGIIADKYPGMDMISIGPDLKYPHSPDEKVSIQAIGKVWDFVAALLKATR